MTAADPYAWVLVGLVAIGTFIFLKGFTDPAFSLQDQLDKDFPMIPCVCKNCLYTAKHGGYMPHSYSKQTEPPEGDNMYIITLPIDHIADKEELEILRTLPTQAVPWHGGHNHRLDNTHHRVAMGLQQKHLVNGRYRPTTHKLPVHSRNAASLIGYHDYDSNRVWLLKERQWGMCGWISVEDYRGLVKLHMEP